MKTATVTKLIAFIRTNSETYKLWYADTRYFRSKVVDLDDDEFCDQIVSRDHIYYVSREGKYDEVDDFTAKFNCFENAWQLFNWIIQRHGFEEVFLCNDIEDYNPYKAWEEDDPSWEDDYQYEKDYGPSNPWDAPGMKVSDFIRGVI